MDKYREDDHRLLYIRRDHGYTIYNVSELHL